VLVKRLILVVVVVVAFALPAFAQVNAAADRLPPRERRVVINIDEQVIEASPRRPEAMPIVGNGRKTPHKSLIRMRTDFRQEVLSSIARL
jgi:hypothetical protein